MPQPLEMTTTSSEKTTKQAEHTPRSQPSASPRPSLPEVMEPVTSSSYRSRSRFASQTMKIIEGPSRRFDNAETLSSGSSQLSVKSRDENSNRTKRRFSPQPIESTTRSSHNPGSKAGRKEDNLLPHERAWESASDASSDGNNLADAAPLLPHERISPPAKPAPPRRFAPLLIETAKRSRKTGDTSPAVLFHDKTNISPGEVLSSKLPRPSPSPMPPSNTPSTSQTQIPLFVPRPNRQGSIHVHYNTRANTRAHSFKVPKLDAIESSGSDGSPPSLSRTQSATSDLSEDYKHATRRRESVDDRFSGYLLALAARAAEKQLREAEAAAFPNTDSHERVSHYVNRHDSDDVEQDSFRHGTRRDSTDDKSALQEMQKHGAKIKEQQAGRKTKGFNVEFDSEPSQMDVWDNSSPKNVIGGHQKDPDLKQMRRAAAPPMLGGDISFPRCPSPEHARFDVTQGADFLRNSMCYLTEQSSEPPGGLWGKKESSTQKSSGWQRPVSPKPTQAAGGLWGGRCTKSEVKPAAAAPTGLLTPIRTPAHTPLVEKDDPFAAYSLASGPAPSSVNITARRAPPSPPASATSSTKSLPSHLHAHLETEALLDVEFNDAFVTQVYNYLSLGFPALAHKFDDELSRISRVPVADLRADDALAEVRGFVRFEADETLAAGVQEEMCARWRALRVYVREWGRQQVAKGANLAGGDPHRAWGLPQGLPDRRGSWGI